MNTIFEIVLLESSVHLFTIELLVNCLKSSGIRYLNLKIVKNTFLLLIKQTYLYLKVRVDMHMCFCSVLNLLALNIESFLHFVNKWRVFFQP